MCERNEYALLQMCRECRKGILCLIDLERLRLLTSAFCLAVVLLLGKPALLSDSAERAFVAGELLLNLKRRRLCIFFPTLSSDLFLRGRGDH